MSTGGKPTLAERSEGGEWEGGVGEVHAGQAREVLAAVSKVLDGVLFLRMLESQWGEQQSEKIWPTCLKRSQSSLVAQRKQI